MIRTFSVFLFLWAAFGCRPLGPTNCREAARISCVAAGKTILAFDHIQVCPGPRELAILGFNDAAWRDQRGIPIPAVCLIRWPDGSTSTWPDNPCKPKEITK